LIVIFLRVNNILEVRVLAVVRVMIRTRNVRREKDLHRRRRQSEVAEEKEEKDPKVLQSYH
jgi:hypothetical protein